MTDKLRLLHDLSRFPLPKGVPVIVHSSVKSVGDIDGGADTLLEALIEFFTRDGGLLCIPTHTWDRDVCDVLHSNTCIGLLPNLAAKHPSAVRSEHPTHSMAVFGEGAREFVKNEPFVNTPVSPDGAYGNLYKMDGYVFLIGVGHNKNTFIHCVEEAMKVQNRLGAPYTFTIINEKGESIPRPILWFDESEVGDVSVNFSKYEPAFRHHGIVFDGSLGDAKCQLCSARKIKEVMELIRERSQRVELLADDAPLNPEYYE